MKIRPKNWASFQHYHKPGTTPAWIKLYGKLLDDFEFHSMPVAARALAPMLWLLAREQPDGLIDATPEKLAFRLRWPVSEISDGLSPLIGKGFFEVAQFPPPDSRPTLEPVYAGARAEESRGEEIREETPIVPLPRDGASLATKAVRQKQARELLEFLNAKAGRFFRPVPANLKFIEARLAEGVTVQDLKTLTVRKCRDWLGSDMAKFLRPETLFNATKCQQYLGEIPPEAQCSVPNATAVSPQVTPHAPAVGSSPSDSAPADPSRIRDMAGVLGRTLTAAGASTREH